MTTQTLTVLLQVSAISQTALGIANLFLVRIMGWQKALDALPALARQVFVVHSWFISVILAVFASTTWLFADEMVGGTNASMTWMALCIALFWTLRFVLQWTYYSRAHWMGMRWPTIVHLGCAAVYGGWSCVYWMTVLRG